MARPPVGSPTPDAAESRDDLVAELFQAELPTAPEGILPRSYELVPVDDVILPVIFPGSGQPACVPHWFAEMKLVWQFSRDQLAGRPLPQGAEPTPEQAGLIDHINRDCSLLPFQELLACYETARLRAAAEAAQQCENHGRLTADSPLTHGRLTADLHTNATASPLSPDQLGLVRLYPGSRPSPCVFRAGLTLLPLACVAGLLPHIPWARLAAKFLGLAPSPSEMLAVGWAVRALQLPLTFWAGHPACERLVLLTTVLVLAPECRPEAVDLRQAAQELFLLQQQQKQKQQEEQNSASNRPESPLIDVTSLSETEDDSAPGCENWPPRQQPECGQTLQEGRLPTLPSVSGGKKEDKGSGSNGKGGGSRKRRDKGGSSKGQSRSNGKSGGGGSSSPNGNPLQASVSKA